MVVKRPLSARGRRKRTRRGRGRSGSGGPGSSGAGRCEIYSEHEESRLTWCSTSVSGLLNGRDDRIRTCDPLTPRSQLPPPSCDDSEMRNISERSRRRWTLTSLTFCSTDGPQSAPPDQSHGSRVSQVASGALPALRQSKESASPFTETLVHRSRAVPSKKPRPGRWGPRQIDSVPQLSALNLSVVVLIDEHRPPLIDCVNDIGFGFGFGLKGKLK